jgi:hypothetical protein
MVGSHQHPISGEGILDCLCARQYVDWWYSQNRHRVLAPGPVYATTRREVAQVTKHTAAITSALLARLVGFVVGVRTYEDEDALQDMRRNVGEKLRRVMSGREDRSLTAEAGAGRQKVVDSVTLLLVLVLAAEG